MLLFGRDRERHFPDAWIQAGRFDETNKSRIADQREIRSLPVRAIEEAIAFVEKHSTRQVDIGEVRRKERWNLPPVAVREAVIDAVAHTDYAERGAPIRISIFDDRLEIETLKDGRLIDLISNIGGKAGYGGSHNRLLLL